MKKIYFKSFITALLLLCSSVASAHDFEVDGIYYNITDATVKTVAVTYKGEYSYQYPNRYNGAITIPSAVTYNGTTHSVTSIGYYAFLSCDGLTSVTIPNSVTSIGDEAFYNCSGLTSITIPNSVTSIGVFAFGDCSGLTSVTIGNSVTSIGGGAFEGCTGLTSVTIPNSVTSIGGGAFRGCKGLTSITIPNSVTSIGYEAFASCTGLKSITIPNSVTTIENRAFEGCTGLRIVYNNSSLDITAGSSNHGFVAYYANIIVTKDDDIQGDFIFRTTNGINTLIAYAGNDSVITLPENYNGENYTIGNGAFLDCTTLTSVTIPNSVTSIGYYAFLNCPLEKVEINTRTIDSWFGGHTSIKEIIIGNSVTSIGERAFGGCTNLTSVTIGNSVTSIGNYAFDGCTGLTSVTIGNSVTSIGHYAFDGCSGITSVTIGNSVTSIGDEAFYNCYIKKVIWLTNTPPTGYSNISAEVHYVSNDLYTKLNKVKVYPYLSYIFTVDGVKYVPINPSQRTCDAIDCLHDNSAEKIIVGKTVKYKNIEMTVNKLMPYAFYGNKYIKNATISNNGDIGTYAFSGCTSLENATISNNGDIGDSAFRGCTSLATVSINNKDCIGDYAFYGCSSLKEVVLPDSVTSLGNYSFQSCSALESVVIGNGVKKIGNWAFSHCTNLNYFAFGRNMKTIGEEAFSDCNNLTTIISLATTPPVCGSQALDDINKWECVLYVPGNYISTYQTAEQWKDFFFIENAPISFTADVDGDGSIDVADVTEVVDAILNGEGENENTPFEIIFDAWTSTNTANSSTSQKSYTLEVTEGSVLTFDWKVSSENNYDWLIITLDGTQILKKSGSYSGSYEHTFNTAGTHTLVVKYTKDGSSSSGSDQGKIHNIKLTGTANDTTDVNADVDGDGSIDIADVTALVEIILGTKQ